ncbi:hypothetical protein PUN28_013853 [Cardiocondyla obscurior]|uniref:Uncharacterized protein n=1 Tax=Cardiocondyla obscurior TaxID=286306 RepID=A0AAW2F3F5_9HYME
MCQASYKVSSVKLFCYAYELLFYLTSRDLRKPSPGRFVEAPVSILLALLAPSATTTDFSTRLPCTSSPTSVTHNNTNVSVQHVKERVSVTPRRR